MEDTEIKEKFEEIYKSKIEPSIRRLEPYRLEQKKKYDLFFRINIALFAIAIISFIIAIKVPIQVNTWGLSQKLAVFFVVCVITSFFTITKQHKISKDFRKTIKPALLKPILSIFGNFRLAENELLSLKEIKSMGLYHNAGTKKDDDNIIGTYKDIPLTLIETELTHSSGGKNSSTVTDFGGLILKIKMNKRFEGITVGNQKVNIENYIKLLKDVSKKNPELYPPEKLKWLDSPIFKTISQTQKFMSENKLFLKNGKLYIDIFDRLTKNKVTRKLEKINVEDPEFNSNYDIYSDNQVESRYLLSPSFIEKIKNIQSVFLVTSVNFVFKEEFLYLFLDGSSMASELIAEPKKGHQQANGFFEVGDIGNTLIDKKIYLKLFRELVSIFSLINYFKINEKTGL